MKNGFYVTWIAALILPLLLIGCGSDASHIEKILNRCAEISRQVSGRGLGPATQARMVADAFQTLNVSDCPVDFRIAFQDHINAWRNAQAAFSSNNLPNNFLEGFIAGVREDPASIGCLQAQANLAASQVNATYYELTRIAARYGARIPRAEVEN